MRIFYGKKSTLIITWNGQFFRNFAFLLFGKLFENTTFFDETLYYEQLFVIK